jgi:hypothetical protein
VNIAVADAFTRVMDVGKLASVGDCPMLRVEIGLRVKGVKGENIYRRHTNYVQVV